MVASLERHREVSFPAKDSASKNSSSKDSESKGNRRQRDLLQASHVAIEDLLQLFSSSPTISSSTLSP